jgi:ABC-type bacteriocin/lantibiotic exporter with double-glycine peptidase domain
MFKLNLKNSLKKLLFYYRTPSVIQLEYSECGASCLSIILKHYGYNIPIEILREECGVTRNGSNANNIINAASKFDFQASAYSLDIKELDNNLLPAILFWQFNHFIVLEYISKNHFYINDPATGHRRISHNEFSNLFTGIILIIKPGKDIKKTQSNNFVQINDKLLYIRNILIENKTDIIFLIICTILLGLEPIIQSGVQSFFWDEYLIKGQHYLFPFMISILTISSITGVYTNFIWQTESSYSSALIILRNFNILLQKLFSLPLLFFYQRSIGEVIARLSAVHSITNFCLNQVTNLLINTVLTLFSIVGIAIIDIKIAMYIISFMFFFITYLFFSKYQLQEYENKNLNYANQFYSQSLATFKFYQTILAHGYSQYSAMKLIITQLNKLVNFHNLQILLHRFQIVRDIWDILSQISIFCYGGYKVLLGDLTVGQLIALSTLYYILYQQINKILKILEEWQKVNSQLTRILDLIQYPNTKLITSSNLLLDKINKIDIQDVNFKYHKLEAYILKSISLNFNNKKHVAIVGKSGSGKSTLIKILLKFLRASSGQVLINNISIDLISSKELYKQIAYVAQEIKLFNATIYDNLTLFQTNIPKDQIIKVLESLDLSHLVTRGLFSYVNEENNNLSGGEMQRLEIARAILRNPSLLILDEATSALDSETENKVLSYLRTINCIVIHVTHKYHVANSTDYVYLLENGSIIEHGIPKDLLLKKLQYYNLFKSNF